MKHPLAMAWTFSALIFLGMDALWLSLMAPRLYRPEIGTLLRGSFDLVPALLFYALYVSGMAAFAVRPALVAGRPLVAGRLGALLGLVSYGTYDLTNQATLVGWTWRVTLADLAWGSLATGAAAALSSMATLAIVHMRLQRR
ncbi:MAG: DUF2177 family protein [Proteobacteria bacterium]|nr:DUF2177 family protein [Pseudomonadota bacterium]